MVAKGLGSAAPLAFICCAIAMVLFVTCFAIAGSRVSLTGGLYAYVEVAFGRYVGFLAGMVSSLWHRRGRRRRERIGKLRRFGGAVPRRSGDAHYRDARGLWFPRLDQHSRRPGGRRGRHGDHAGQASATAVVHLRWIFFYSPAKSVLERLAEQQVVRRCCYPFDFRFRRD